MTKFSTLLTKNINLQFCSIALILLIGAFLRFYKLDWGEGYHFHPDEYHIAIAAGRLSFPTQLNPELFSYGSFSIYLIYFTKSIFALKSSFFLIGRFYSALFSTLGIIAVYKISKEISKSIYFQATATLLTAITPGLIQQAHFATPESALTLWLMSIVLFWIKWVNKYEYKYLFLSSIFLGLAIATKITAIIYLPILIIIPFLNVLKKKAVNFRTVITNTTYSFFLAVTVFITAFLFFPFAILDWDNFLHSMNYETAVGSGSQTVFYTRQFINTLPLAFQYQKILPYALGIPVMVFGTLGLTLLIFEVMKKPKNIIKRPYQRKLILLISFSIFFFPNAVLFAKWTRFIAPTFPYFCIFTAYFLYKLINTRKSLFYNYVLHFLTFIILIASLMWTAMFFSIYKSPDIRITATKWINENVSNNSHILTESGNMLEAPLSGNNQKTAFDFYHLDENVKLQKELPDLLEKSDYFIVQSRRIFANHQRFPENFPVTARFYNLLFSRKLGFVKIKEFNSFPKLVIGHWSLVIADESAEETWSVFDHPVIRIYKKTKLMNKEDYEKILKI
jgi:hypothetical protein